ncbi:hypothetical protein [Salinimicrobium sp. TH3]|uniref:hypothetical protein n=1 Tax=Salinimicrobium sp. TH3 TaxID=2997342 RepID=UPI002275F1A7|nr:hypothetical protein [Salinimicrobium sp. TH3]MCY2687292.1 hypothetical protein [Salinimicrobium sp. TH3]
MMKTKNILLLGLLFFLPFICSGQIVIQDKEKIAVVNESPQEKVFVHFNSSFLLAGEYLYYKIYVLDHQTLVPGDLSSVAYVELRGKDGEVIFRHKIALENGTGEGDFFISTNVLSGNYKLFGYTRWMLNGELNNFFQADVVIVNPYTRNNEGLLASVDKEGSAGMLKDTLKSTSTIANRPGNSKNLPTYGKRERVALNIDGMQEMDPKGNYSVSVRKLHNIQVPKMVVSEDISGKGKFFKIEPGKRFYLPELRGELFSGKLRDAKGNQQTSVENKKVALSIPGQNFIFKIARTNANGEFFFNVEKQNLAEEVILQVLNEEKGKFKIVIDPHPELQIADLDFGNFQLTRDMEDLLVEESIYNQIENGYFSIKPDTVKLPEQELPFYGKRILTYDLDDYTRFNTLKETFVEIVREITTSGDMLRIRGYNSLVDSRMPPLLIVDGVIIQDHSKFINFPARRIQSIGVLRDKYFYGPEVFQGIINVETVEKDFLEKNGKDFFKTHLMRPQPEKEYFQQKYSEGQRNERIPDFRRQLLWNPVFDPESRSIEFYTSDVEGEFEIVLEGFTSAGKGVTLKEKIEVK